MPEFLSEEYIKENDVEYDESVFSEEERNIKEQV